MEEMRTRILPRMLNDEAETYLTRNDVIIVPVGTVELHGGLPLDSETVISEAFALRMAEAADGTAVFLRRGHGHWTRHDSGQRAGRHRLSGSDCEKPSPSGLQAPDLRQLSRPRPYDLLSDDPGFLR